MKGKNWTCVLNNCRDSPAFETCPVCYIDLPVCQIQEHADTCCSKQESDPEVVPSVVNK